MFGNIIADSFNTQPPEGGWRESTIKASGNRAIVSTHSRPKAAGSFLSAFAKAPTVFQHTAARRRLVAG